MKSKPLPDIDPSRLSRSQELREALELSLVLLEHQAGELKVLREELRKVQDELLRLKGEKGKPQFKGKSKGPAGTTSSLPTTTQPNALVSAFGAIRPVSKSPTCDK